MERITYTLNEMNRINAGRKHLSIEAMISNYKTKEKYLQNKEREAIELGLKKEK